MKKSVACRILKVEVKVAKVDGRQLRHGISFLYR